MPDLVDLHCDECLLKDRSSAIAAHTRLFFDLTRSGALGVRLETNKQGMVHVENLDSWLDLWILGLKNTKQRQSVSSTVQNETNRSPGRSP